MLLARVCRAGYAPRLTSLLKAPVVPRPLLPQINSTRLYATSGRSAFRIRTRAAEKPSIKWNEQAYSVGQKAMMGGTLLGAGALAYYGLGMSDRAGIIEKSGLWPQYVRDRVKSIYQYIGGSLVITAGATMLAMRSPAVMRLVMAPGIGAFVVQIGVLMGSLILLQSLPYKEGFGIKQLAWVGCCGLMGTMVAPMCALGGPAVARALLTTAGAVGGLTTIALCAPDRKFLTWAGPLGLGLGAVFTAGLVAPFTSPMGAVGASLYSISLYGGLLLFSAFLLYDTQKAVTAAELHPTPPFDGGRPFDPINAAMSIYLDILNIFVRLVDHQRRR